MSWLGLQSDSLNHWSFRKDGILSHIIPNKLHFHLYSTKKPQHFSLGFKVKYSITRFFKLINCYLLTNFDAFLSTIHCFIQGACQSSAVLCSVCNIRKQCISVESKRSTSWTTGESSRGDTNIKQTSKWWVTEKFCCRVLH